MRKQTTEPSVTADGRASVDAADDGGWERWRTLTTEAHVRFHDNLLASRAKFPGLADYGTLERVQAARGTFAWWWGAAGEIQETINSVNS